MTNTLAYCSAMLVVVVKENVNERKKMGGEEQSELGAML
jgi:hypothetical protein